MKWLCCCHLFWYLSVSVRLWVHPNVGSWLILNFNYSHPNQLHSHSRSPELFPVSLHFSLFLAFCPATAAPSINVLPDCIPLIPTCFLWLEEQWALLAAKLHLGAFTWASGKKWVSILLSIWAFVKISFDNDFCCKYFTLRTNNCPSLHEHVNQTHQKQTCRLSRHEH